MEAVGGELRLLHADIVGEIPVHVAADLLRRFFRVHIGVGCHGLCVDACVRAAAASHMHRMADDGGGSLFERLAEAKKDARALANVKLAAIGSATANALAGHGLTADLIPSAYKAEELAEALAGEITAGDKILLARAKVAREVLPESLRKIGAIVDVVTAYETVADCENKEELIAALESGEASVVTFTSSSTVTNLLEVLGDKKELLNKAALAAIGPVTADTLKKHGYTPAINAAEYTIDGLMTAITNFYNK